jgi:predicted ArsR family transcriptional regulator
MNVLRDRILGALRLRPMTVAELAQCLSVRPTSVRQRLGEIDVHRVGTVRTKGRPWIRYAA